MAEFSQSRKKICLTLAAITSTMLAASELDAQRPRFPDYFQTSSPAQAPVIQDPAVLPGVVQPVVPNAPPAQIVVPNFDPFQSPTQPLPFGASPEFDAASTIPTLPFDTSSNVQVLPPAQNESFPRASQTGQYWQRFRDDWLPRLFERPRFRYTYLPGDNGNELQIHDIEAALTLTIPRFFFIQQPIRITPGFIAHFWAGPETFGPNGTGFDLPARAYSGFLNLEHVTDPCAIIGAETYFTIGYYSDFNNGNSNSVRYTGVALGWWRMNTTSVFKFGVEYFDRVDLKLLPAFGVFLRPTPNLQVDLYFPRPRIAQRLPDFYCRQFWAYVAGEYGGGSWTVDRNIGFGVFGDQIDINDYRAFVGLESVGPRGLHSFVEFGYVFNRKLVSRVQIPSRSLDLQDTIMLRMGLAF